MDYVVPDLEVPYDTDSEVVQEALQLLEEPKRKRKASCTAKSSDGEEGSRNTSLEADTEEYTPKRRTRSTTRVSSASKEADNTAEEPLEVDNSCEPPKAKRRRGRPPKVNTSDESVIITRSKKAKMKQHDFTTANWLKERNILILPEKERPTPDVINVMTPVMHDYQNWKDIEADLTCCMKDYEKLRTCAESQLAVLEGNDQVGTLFNYRLTWDKQDTLAHSLFPRDGPYDRSQAFEITTRSVGDCLLDAMSRLTFGNQNHARELRTRMTLEGLAHEQWYLEHDNLGINLPLLTTDHSLPERYALHSGTRSDDFTNAYRQEIKRCFKNGEYCGLWQIHQLATVVGRPITSVFPEFDDMEDDAPLRYYYNRIIYPRREQDRSKETAVIMWTKASPFAEDLANHIVPVVT